MKLTPMTFAAIAITTILTTGALRPALAIAPLPTQAIPPVSTLAQTPSQSTAQVQANPDIASTSLKTGTFVASEHPTAGTARIITENGKRYLEFDAAFMTDAGPDLFVLLHQQATPQTYTPQDYLSLGRLQQTNGMQRYAIPDDTDLSQFQSAVIWCRQFNATFGFAAFWVDG